MLRWVLDAPHVDGHRVTSQRHVGKEILAGVQRQQLVIAIIVFAVVHFHTETAVTRRVVDAEAEQHLITHLPKQLLVCQPFHTRRGQHLLYLVDVVPVAVNGAVSHLAPRELLVHLRHIVKRGHVGDILGIIELEILC